MAAVMVEGDGGGDGGGEGGGDGGDSVGDGGGDCGGDDAAVGDGRTPAAKAVVTDAVTAVVGRW